jgi:elongation factor P
VALSINDIKTGLTILVDNQAHIVLDTQHVKPGKGAAFVRAKIKNLKTGVIQERTFRGDEKIDEAFIEERKLQYQYVSSHMYHFMDQNNFEEIAVSEDILSDKIKFLKDNIEVTAYSYNNEILNINLPNFIDVSVVHTEPGVKGDTAKGGTKPAEIETGATIQVPLFIDIDDRIKIDTRTGGYVERTG